MALTDLIPFAEQVRDETQAGANTAIRVGQLFVDIITQAAQQDQTLAQALAALPALPFDSVRFHTTNNQGQDQWTGDQTIEFLSNGVVVATLPIKVAAQAYSGLMSAADKAKLDAIPAIVVSGDDAIGSLIASATQNSMDITPYAVDGTIKTPISIPVVQRTQNGAVSAGVVPAALQNSVDIYGQGLILDINGRTTASVILVGCRVCRGSQLTIESMDNVTCDGTIDVGVSESNIPWLSGERMGLTSERPSVSFDVSNGLANLQLSENYMTINAFQITLTSAQNVRLRVRVTGVDSAGGVAVLTFTQSANGVQIYGKDGTGTNITMVNLPAASTTRAGVMSAIDKHKLNGIEDGAQPNVQSDWLENDNTSAAYIVNKPTIGTAAALNAPVLGNASATEVVKGNDTRLTDARPANDVYDWAKEPAPPVVTKADVGLGNCDNTSDLNKPISTATQTALNGKQDVLPIETTSAAESLDASADKYYILTSTIGTFSIALPTMTDAAKAHTIGIYLTTGATPAITITGTNTIKYDDTWAIDANTTHEINALWNGTAWVLTLIHVA